MRAQDKRNVIACYRISASPQQAAAELNLPLSEVQAIYAKERKKLR